MDGNTGVEAFCNHAINKKKMENGDEPQNIYIYIFES